MSSVQIYGVFDLLYYSCKSYWQTVYDIPLDSYELNANDDELSRYVYSKVCLDYLTSLGVLAHDYDHITFSSKYTLSFDKLDSLVSSWGIKINPSRLSYYDNYNSVRLHNALDVAFVLMSTKLQTEKELGISDDVLSLSEDSLKGLLASCISYYYLNELKTLNDDYELSLRDKDSLSSLLYLTVSKLKGYATSEPILLGERLEEIAKLNIKIGDVVFLYRRSLKGEELKIDECVIAILKSVKDNKFVFWTVPFSDTIENRLITFSKFPEDLRELYGDLRTFLNVENKLGITTLDILDVGVGFAFVSQGDFQDEYIMSPIESIYPTIVSIFTDSGAVNKYSFSVQEAVFYMLYQYNIKFNDKRYRERYRGDFDEVYKLCMESKNVLREVYNVNI